MDNSKHAHAIFPEPGTVPTIKFDVETLNQLALKYSDRIRDELDPPHVQEALQQAIKGISQIIVGFIHSDPVPTCHAVAVGFKICECEVLIHGGERAASIGSAVESRLPNKVKHPLTDEGRAMIRDSASERSIAKEFGISRSVAKRWITELEAEDKKTS